MPEPCTALVREKIYIKNISRCSWYRAIKKKIHHHYEIQKKMAVCCRHHRNHRNSLCWQNIEFLYVGIGGV